MKKKLFVSAMIIALAAGTCAVYAGNEINTAIQNYKKGNYVGCISSLRIYNETNPNNAVSWYYLGNAYMKIGMKDEAHEAFERVIKLNTVPKLTSYALQAEICMENPLRCQYQNFTYDEIQAMKANPSEFLDQYFANKNQKPEKTPDTVEIEKLIKGAYADGIHSDAKNVIIRIKTETGSSTNKV